MTRQNKARQTQDNNRQEKKTMTKPGRIWQDWRKDKDEYEVEDRRPRWPPVVDFHCWLLTNRFTRICKSWKLLVNFKFSIFLCFVFSALLLLRAWDKVRGEERGVSCPLERVHFHLSKEVKLRMSTPEIKTRFNQAHMCPSVCMPCSVSCFLTLISCLVFVSYPHFIPRPLCSFRLFHIYFLCTLCFAVTLPVCVGNFLSPRPSHFL